MSLEANTKTARELIHKSGMGGGDLDALIAQALANAFNEGYEVGSDTSRVTLDKKPTIHELEAILDEDNLATRINPDGSVTTRPSSDDG